MSKNQNFFRSLLFALLILVIGFLLGALYWSIKSDPRRVLLKADTATTDTVSNDNLDGSVWQVKRWMQDNLKDPDSVQFMGWSGVTEAKEGGYLVTCKYRAKNSFGGYAIEKTTFHLDSQGNVTMAFTSEGKVFVNLPLP